MSGTQCGYTIPSIQGNDAGGLRAIHGGHVDLHLHPGHGTHRGGLSDGIAAGVSQTYRSINYRIITYRIMKL